MCASKFHGDLGFLKSLNVFNMALLAKQGWQILKNENTLLHQVLKARYFPKSSFFYASLSSTASFTWRGIWEAKKWLDKGCTWGIRDGNQVRIWEDHWIPKENVTLTPPAPCNPFVLPTIVN